MIQTKVNSIPKHIEEPTKVYSVKYMLSYKKRYYKKPKDLRAVDIPLKSKEGAIERITEEVDNSESLRNLRILLNKVTKDNIARISDSILNNFQYTKEILEGLAVCIGG